MKFVTFNIRYDTLDDGINAFTHRSGVILNKIDAERPDVIGFQECRPHVFDFLRKYLTDYMVVGCGRSTEYEGEHNPVAFLKDKYELIGLETEWLSPDPQVPGSRYEIQSQCPRIVTSATLRPYGTKTPFYVYNTHLDHVSDEARVLGAERVCLLMTERLEKREMPLVVMGDFNAYPGSAPVNVFLDDKFLRLTDHTEGISKSYHGYGTSEQERIDYIMSRGFVETEKTRSWDDNDNGIYLSDHYPLCASLDMEG